jgi:hypothetical protein
VVSRVVFALLLAMSVGVGCSAKASKPTPPPTVETEPPPTGTERWSGGALLLPAESPAVVEARLARLLDATRRLKDWVVAEPAMLGDDGEETVRAIEVAWSSATAYLGVDPTDDQAWIDRGVDPTRPIFAGLYPIGEEGRRFLTSVDATVRQELGIRAGQPIGPSLRALEETSDSLPEGTNSRILRSVSDQHPTDGFRLVIPLSSSTEFMTTISSFAEGFGYRRFPPDLAASVDVSPMERAFWSTEPGAPAFAVRLEGSHAMVDVLFPRFVGGALSAPDPVEDLEAMYVDLGDALRTMKPGRPDAPRAYDQPSLAVSFDQGEMGDYVRLRGYLESLDALQSSSAGKRDAALLESLRRTAAQAQAWSVGAGRLTGSSIAAHIGSSGSGPIGRLSLSLFGGGGLPGLEAARRFPTLGISERSASIGVTVAALRDPSWRKWFAGDVAGELDAMDFEVDPVASIFPAVRAAIVAFGAVGDQEIRSTLFGGFDELLRQVDEVERAEIVSLTPDISGQKGRPRLLVAFVLGDDDPREATTYLREIVVDRVADYNGVSNVGELPPVVAGSTETIQLEGATVHYRLDTVEPAVVLFGVDVDIQTLENELTAMRTRQSAPVVVAGRLEPISMVSWFQTDDPELFDPIDPNILAQRLGPVTLQFAPRRGDDASAITIDVELAAPPKL